MNIVIATSSFQKIITILSHKSISPIIADQNITAPIAKCIWISAPT